MKLESVLANALKLSIRGRAELAARLLRSIDDAVEIEPAHEESWNREIVKRVGEVRSGKAKGVSASTVFKRARARAKSRR